MDIKGKISQIVEKIKSDKEFGKKFKENPVKAVESVIGMDLPDDQINSVIEGVKAKLSIESASDAMGSLKKLF